MTDDFPPAVPEIPVNDVDQAASYYKERLGFAIDWGDQGGGGIGGVSRGHCRLFLTNRAFREMYGNHAHVVIWLNLNSKKEVDALHESWRRSGARIVSVPESKPWKLHEFTAADLDGNLIRVFYDFRWET
jgi:predicted lactoylglutathione lyase